VPPSWASNFFPVEVQAIDIVVACGAHPEIKGLLGPIMVNETNQAARFLKIYVVGDLTINLKIMTAFQDLDSVHAVVEVKRAMIALDDNLFGVGFIYRGSKLQLAVVAFNHQLGDFSEDCQFYIQAGVAHN